MKSIMRILHLDSSSRTKEDGSYSRIYSEEVVLALKKQYNLIEQVFRRDLIFGENQIPSYIDKYWAKSLGQEERLKEENRLSLNESNKLIEELQMATIYVFGIPMYNLSVPACFKAYIDQVIRLNKTFDSHYKGLLYEKELYIICTRGGGEYEEGQKNYHLNFQTNYLKANFKLIGLHEDKIHFLCIEHTGGQGGPDLTEAKKFIENLSRPNNSEESEQSEILQSV